MGRVPSLAAQRKAEAPPKHVLSELSHVQSGPKWTLQGRWRPQRAGSGRDAGVGLPTDQLEPTRSLGARGTRKAGFGFGERSGGSGRTLAPGPGPGSYPVTSTLGAKAYTMRPKCAPVVKRSRSAPLGPVPDLPRSERTVTFGTAARPGSAPARSRHNTVPGPGEYDLRGNTLGGPLYTMGRKSETIGRAHQGPGPGPVPQPIHGAGAFPRTPGYTMCGRAKDPIDRRLDVQPYKPPSTLMGKGTTFGPPKTFVLGQPAGEHRKPVETTSMPGPGHYGAPDPAHFVPGGNMGQRYKPSKAPYRAPGPGHYKLDRGWRAAVDLGPQGPTFGKEQRPPPPPKSDQKPCASYVPKGLGHNLSGGRMKPYVGQVRPKSAPQLRSHSYNPKTTLNGGGWSFGTGKRPPLNKAGAGPDMPGPGEYHLSGIGEASTDTGRWRKGGGLLSGREPWMSAEDKKRKNALQMEQSGRLPPGSHMQPLDDVPGPGYYAPYTVFA